MNTSAEVNSIIQRNILNGAKTPHSTSLPVLYKHQDKYYLAVFVFFYNKEDIESGMINRPSVWAISDIESGEILQEYQCSEKDFSDASYDIKYNIRSTEKYDTSAAYREETFATLDSVRAKIIENSTFDNALYSKYLSRVVANIPQEYKRFYFDLSMKVEKLEHKSEPASYEY